MIDRVRRSLVVIVVVLVGIAAGCGGSDDRGLQRNLGQPDPRTFADQQLELRLSANQTADPFTCGEDGDDPQNWKCTTRCTNRQPGRPDRGRRRVPLTVKVTCDETGSCVYEPET